MSKAQMETVLITGASAGIGEALAKRFAKGGYDLVLVARRADKLEALAESLRRRHQVQVSVEPLDLSETSAAEKLVDKFAAEGTTIDILVNNAGILETGTFVDTRPERHQELIKLNLSALTDMLAHFLPPMVKRGRGKILNISSISAFLPVPSLATYAATKAYVLSLTESLSEELKGTGVSVTALCPGITDTNMVEEAKNQSEDLIVPGFIVSDVKDVAEEGYKACTRGEVVRVPGMVNFTTALTSRATPKWLLRRIMGFVRPFA